MEWDGPPPAVDLQVYADNSKTILAKNDSPDLPFTWSLNPYRGCMHACAYCYARPTHQYLDWGAGTDFDRKITFKPEAASLLRKTFMKRSWQGESVLFSGNTDCYQPLEASYKLTRACLEVCLEFRNPVSIITKSALIERDIDLLAELAREASCFVTMSIPFWDAEACRKVEPFAPKPQRRIRAMQRLHEAGIPVGVNVAPIIPGLNDQDIPAILEAAHGAGAIRAGHIMVRLSGPVEAVFEERIRAAFPMRADRVLSRIRDARDGKMNNSGFGDRMTGKGQYWGAIDTLFKTTCARLGLNSETIGVDRVECSTFRRPQEAVQLSLL